MEEATDPNLSQSPSIEDLAPLFPAYEFHRFIAAGGMGAVYQARQKSLDRPVAIKILARELGNDPVFRASFEAEAKAMARLNHSNLIGVYDFGDADGMLFIVMEMVNGKSLHESAHGRTIDPVQAGNIVAAISRGLEHAHNAGILHRDIKPGNILLDSEANPKIGDFGLAMPMGEKTSEDELIYGTPGYTAPEVYQRQGDHRADIFSVGILLYELLTGSLPDGSGTPPSMRCGCPRAFDKIVARATNPNPVARYQNAGELAAELDKAVLEGGAANASTNRLVLPTAAASAGVSKSVSASKVKIAKAQLASKPRGNGPLIMFAVAGVLFVIGLIAMLGSGGGDGGGGASVEAKRKKAKAAEQAKRERERQRRERWDGNQRRPGSQEDRGGKKERGKNPQAGKQAGRPVKKDSLVRPSPIESLAVLKAELAAGGRDEFPAGSESRGSSQFVLVDQAVTWDEARELAEAHGAHLATLTTPTDRKWFRENFPSDDPVWLGGGMAADDRWQWLDGSRWITSGAALGAAPGRRHLSLGKNGALVANAAGERFHFALQWRDDASNPATIGAQLKRTVQSIEEGGFESATYPVGARTHSTSGSHFLMVPKATDWDSARKLANAAGGYLAVPSSRVESDWIRATFGADLGGRSLGLWLGGFRLKVGEPWRWLTKEAWNYSTGWIGGSEPSDPSPGRLLLRLGSEGVGWLSQPASAGAADGMLIEWSLPKEAAEIANFNLEEWLGNTKRNFAKRLQAEIDDYEKEHGLLIARYLRSISRLGRKHIGGLVGQDGRKQDRIREAVEEVVDEVERSQKLVASIPKGAPDDFHELQEKTKQDLDELIANFRKAVESDLRVFSQGLEKQAAKLKKDGFDQAAEALTLEVGTLGGEASAFIERLGLVDPTGGVIGGGAGAAEGGAEKEAGDAAVDE